MGIFSSPKKEKKLVAVFDVGSASVGGALFFMHKSGLPEIIFSTREPIAFEEKLNTEKFFSLTMKSLEIVASRVCTSGLGAPKQIFCVLSAPWYASQTRVITLEKNNVFTFTNKLADDLIKKEINFLEQEHKSKNKKSSHNLRHIELRSIKTLLNGYQTLEPIGKKARELEMSILVSMSPEQVLEKIEDVISRHFHSKDVQYSSFNTAAFTVARDMLIHHENFLLVDVGGEMTEVSIIKKNVLSESASFPFGRNFITRGVAKALNSSLGEAKSLISLYKDEHAHHATERKLAPIINKLKNEWLKNFQQSLASLSKDFSIPSVVFLTADSDMRAFFKEIIKAEQFHQYAFTESKFQIAVLDTKALHGIATFKDDVTRDASLIIESVYLNNFLS